ncbi:hypothetical protein DUNSADRAFT_15807 [Dunaliella salina]|uniref:Uncharacterized protein n=1 Tax=Dunaliella salina TaxID=3046 RepID=A0ABQ7H1G9_DUNSA|nr:hypothetical protein DUNSADRAFT_15807 [Dunaliella salina]|eukprot:KAF5840712.1 hypothetical protein DUNSADRAFT_15807 [Dunaliella salina]
MLPFSILNASSHTGAQVVNGCPGNIAGGRVCCLHIELQEKMWWRKPSPMCVPFDGNSFPARIAQGGGCAREERWEGHLSPELCESLDSNNKGCIQVWAHNINAAIHEKNNVFIHSDYVTYVAITQASLPSWASHGSGPHGLALKQQGNWKKGVHVCSSCFLMRKRKREERKLSV